MATSKQEMEEILEAIEGLETMGIHINKKKTQIITD
jgi:hypothetical protein